MPTLTIIRGASGSGKSTLAKSLSESLGVKYFEADMFFYGKEGEYSFNFKLLGAAHAWCRGQVESELIKGKSVIVSNTFIKIKELKLYLKMVEKLGCDLQVIEVQGNFKNIHDVPKSKVQQMKNNFEYFKIND